MLSTKDNETMCRVGRDTPMGKAMRRYWTPAMQSSDLPEPGGDPRRVVLLGDSYVAFRGEDGVVGFLDEGCAHRGVSLALGRVEGCAVRCIFHGWKFAPDGELLEAPNVSDPNFKKRVRARSYPVREAGGLIWVYLGAKALEPRFPHYPWFDLEPRHRINAYLVEQCNYVQTMEALWDSSHLNFLHQDGLAIGGDLDLKFAQQTQNLLLDEAPGFEAEDTDFGFHYAALRPDGGKMLARIAAFVPPYSVVNPNDGLWMSVVPIDDYHSIYFHVWWDEKLEIGLEPHRTEHLKFIGLDDDALRAFGMTYDTINDPDKPFIHNGFKQNRAGMRAGTTFSGFHSFTQEDSAVLMSAGELKDRSFENLCHADAGVARLYRTLLKIAKSSEKGEDPIGLDANPMEIIGTTGYVPEGGKWQDLVPHKRAKPARTDAAIAA
ncbi:MAG TPA: Rieske 2Fe-2S domain-containing protein [Allosphingosinicella sp.]|nr:Rieske 2Fe-2S domain-containing protein [Allosphingosinicella sp.]